MEALSVLVKFGIQPVDPETGQPVHDDASGMAVTGITDATNEDGSYVVGYIVGTDAAAVRDHLFDFQGMVTQLGGNEAIADIYQSLRQRIAPGDRPAWVAVDPQQRDPGNAADLERFLAEFYRCERGEPADLEASHYTLHPDGEFPPGVGPEVTA